MNLTVLSPDIIEMNRNVGKGIYCLVDQIGFKGSRNWLTHNNKSSQLIQKNYRYELVVFQFYSICTHPHTS